MSESIAESAGSGAMTRLDHAILDPAEEFFDAIGMMQGDSAPLKRAALGAVLGYGLAYAFKPKFAFDDQGKPKQWKVTASGPDQDNATWFPVGLIVGLPAFVFGAMI